MIQLGALQGMRAEIEKIATPSPILNVPQPGGLGSVPKSTPAAPVSTQKITGKSLRKLRDNSKSDWSMPQTSVAKPALDAPGSDIPVPAVGA